MILDATRRWYCPNCTVTSITREAQPHTRFHACAGLHGLAAPMLPVGVRAKVTAREREDYLSDELAGRVMSVVTERDDGQDVAIFAPTAKGKVEM